MFSFLSWFLLFTVLYHVFSTRTVFGLELWSASIPALLREGLWCLFLAVLFFVNIKQRKAYRNVWKRSWLSLGAVLLFSVLVSYFVQDKSWNDILIGIKYGFWWLVILLSASGIGFFYHENFWGEKLTKRRSRLLRGLSITVITGFLRQGIKLVRPDFFSRIGYELHLDDRQFDQKPPLYYLTGWEGTLRRQGLFSGPNNYGYFLVAFFPLLLSSFVKGSGRELKQWCRRLLLAIRIAAMVLTLSRAVILGWLLVMILTYRPLVKKNKKLLLRWSIAVVLAFLWLSVLKWDSTLAHLTSKLGAIPQIINQPLGYGLGSSGPAIHHNGTMLPENYYFEILLDTGTVWFLLWCLVLWQLISIQRHIRGKVHGRDESLARSNEAKSCLAATEENFLFVLQRGFFALLLIGFVLHVFEDSMVNYLFFIIYGIALGSLSRLGASR